MPSRAPGTLTHCPRAAQEKSCAHDAQSAPATSAPARQTTAMVYDSDRQRVTLYGGIGDVQGGAFADTWSYGAQ